MTKTTTYAWKSVVNGFFVDDALQAGNQSGVAVGATANGNYLSAWNTSPGFDSIDGRGVAANAIAPAQLAPVTKIFLSDAGWITNGHVEGIAWDGTNYYLSDKAGLYKTDASFNKIAFHSVVADLPASIPARNHVGDISVAGGLVYAPVEFWNGAVGTGCAIGVWNASDLSYSGMLDVSSIFDGADLGAIEVDTTRNCIWATSFVDNTVRKLSMTGALLSSFALPFSGLNLQSLALTPSHTLMIGTNPDDGSSGYIFEVDPDTQHVVGQWYRNLEIDGLAFNGANCVFVTASSANGTTAFAAYSGSLSLTADGSAWVSPSTSEFQVNSTIANQQFDASVAGLAGGNFVVTFTDFSADPGGDIRARLFDSSYKPLASDFLVDGSPSDDAASSVAALTDGGFVVTWTRDLGGNDLDIRAAVFNADGSTRTTLAVDSESSLATSGSAAAGLAGGGFVVAWTQAPVGGGAQSVLLQRYDTGGNAQGGHVLIDNSGVQNNDVQLVALKDGGFVVSYTDSSWNAGLDGLDITMKIFNADGSDRSSAIKVNDIAAGDQSKSTITTLSNGDIVVGFSGGSTFYEQAYDAQGNRLGGNYTVAGSVVEGEIVGLTGGLVADVRTSTFSEGAGLGNSIRSHTDELTRTTISDGAGDVLFGDSLSDTLKGGGGNDVLDGAGGIDVAVYQGARSNFAFSYDEAARRLTISDLRPGAPEGIDTVTNVENFSFAGQIYALDQLINHAPTLALPVTDQGAHADASFVFALPVGTFADADFGDTLMLAAAKAEGTALPAWLSFNAVTHVFAGTPANSDVGALSIKVTATDGSGAAVSDTFDISISHGHYTNPAITLHSFGVSDAAGGWINDNRYHREVGDVNGDNHADLVGFGGDSTFVALSDGNGGFANPIAAINSFGYSDLGGGWGTNDLFPRTIADVDGDHKADIVGFGSAGVWVGIANGDGTFAAPTLKLASFGTDANAGSWTNNTIYHREVADVNGDGMADVVGFGSSGTYVALATGGGNFANPILGLNSFGYAPDGGSWQTNDVYPRTLADVNGDGMADLIGFGDAGVWIAAATGAGHFASPQLVLHSFGASQDAGCWSSDNVFHREVADVDGDGFADIIGFGGVGTYVALGLGNGSFANPELEVSSFGYTNDGGGWGTNGVFPRTLADVSGDKAAELIGFGDEGVWVAHWVTS